MSLDDDAWGLRFALGGLAPGSRTLAKGQGDVLIVSKVRGDQFTTDLGGSCTVWVDPHDSTNGSKVTGWFSCTGLSSSSGKQVTVSAGQFGTFVGDSANNPQPGAPV
jgi:hypothetical protein